MNAGDKLTRLERELQEAYLTIKRICNWIKEEYGIAIPDHILRKTADFGIGIDDNNLIQNLKEEPADTDTDVNDPLFDNDTPHYDQDQRQYSVSDSDYVSSNFITPCFVLLPRIDDIRPELKKFLNPNQTLSKKSRNLIQPRTRTKVKTRPSEEQKLKVINILRNYTASVAGGLGLICPICSRLFADSQRAKGGFKRHLRQSHFYTEEELEEVKRSFRSSRRKGCSCSFLKENDSINDGQFTNIDSVIKEEIFESEPESSWPFDKLVIRTKVKPTEEQKAEAINIYKYKAQKIKINCPICPKIVKKDKNSKGLFKRHLMNLHYFTEEELKMPYQRPGMKCCKCSSNKSNNTNDNHSTKSSTETEIDFESLKSSYPDLSLIKLTSANQTRTQTQTETSCEVEILLSSNSEYFEVEKRLQILDNTYVDSSNSNPFEDTETEILNENSQDQQSNLIGSISNSNKSKNDNDGKVFLVNYPTFMANKEQKQRLTVTENETEVLTPILNPNDYDNNDIEYILPSLLSPSVSANDSEPSQNDLNDQVVKKEPAKFVKTCNSTLNLHKYQIRSKARSTDEGEKAESINIYKYNTQNTKIRSKVRPTEGQKAESINIYKYHAQNTKINCPICPKIVKKDRNSKSLFKRHLMGLHYFTQNELKMPYQGIRIGAQIEASDEQKSEAYDLCKNYIQGEIKCPVPECSKIFEPPAVFGKFNKPVPVRFREHMFKMHNVETTDMKLCRLKNSSSGPRKPRVLIPKPKTKDKTKPPKERQGFLCSICGKIYKFRHNLNIHSMRKHHPDKSLIYKCDKEKCTSAFSNIQSLNQHFKTHQEKSNLCQVCGASFSQSHYLENHMKIHSDKREFKCPKCDREFKQSASLYWHNKRYHTDKSLLKSYPCNTCGLEFRDRFNLKRHNEGVHQSLRKYHCTFANCEKSFKCKGALKYHVQTHFNPNSKKRGYNKPKE